MSKQTINLEDTDLARIVFGEKDRHILQIESAFGTEILVRGTQLTFKGPTESCQKTQSLVQELYRLAKSDT